MKSTINKLSLFLGIACLAACADDSLDPFRLKDQSKGSILALRGDSFDALNADGCSNAFFRNKIVGDETFVIDAEFLSEDPTSLQEIQVYAHYQRPDPDNPGQFLIDKRGSANTFPGSTLSSSGGGNPTGSLSLPLSKILSDVGITVDSDGKTDIEPGDVLNIESDLLLTNGTVVFSTSVVNVGLYQSGIFYPAQTLTYCYNDIDDFYPVPGFSLEKEKPLKGDSVNTLTISFASSIATPPTLALSPNIGTLGTLTPDPDDDSKFTVTYEAPSNYTGPVSIIVDGAVNGGTGATAGLEQQDAAAAIIEVDNTKPQLVAVPVIQNLANPAAGARLGRDQYVNVTLTFQEALDRNEEPLLISVSGQNLDPVEEAAMELSDNGKVATYIYSYKDTDGSTEVTAGDLDFVVTGGSDLAGNAFAGTSFTLLNDVGEPPVPVITLDADYDQGNDVRWIAATTTGGNNPGGSTSGTVVYAVVEHGAPAPTQATADIKGVTVNAGFAWPVGGEPLETGNISVTEGSSGMTLSRLIKNGDLDVYFYFVNATGNVSKNTGPVEVQMN